MNSTLKPVPIVFVFALLTIITMFLIQRTGAQPLSTSTNVSESSVDPLPSWKDGSIKNNIIGFVQKATDPQNIDYYIPPEDRIAVFDNDGTLWSEKPLYFQIYFVLDRVPQIVDLRPDLKEKFPFSEILAKNFTALHDLPEMQVMELLAATHSNITQAEFDELVYNWSKTAKHPETKILFVNMVYQPMLELLKYMEDNQFKNFIVSGGGIDFIRNALSTVYNIPPERIIGSSGKYQFFDKFSNDTAVPLNNSKSFLYRVPELGSIDDKYGKPVNIQLHIGKIPVVVVGNSNGDLQMMGYASDNNPKGKSLEILVHHDDPVREYSYDKGAEKILLEAKNQNWNIVSMKDDFLNIFRQENETGTD